jgi:hypothetical protein
MSSVPERSDERNLVRNELEDVEAGGERQHYGVSQNVEFRREPAEPAKMDSKAERQSGRVKIDPGPQSQRENSGERRHELDST